MSTATLQKNLTFFSLYVAQSVPMSLFSTLLPVLMRQQAFSLTAIALLQLIKLPWILKLFWAPVVDRHTHGLQGYKSWIFASEICYAFCILAIAYCQLQVSFTLVLCLMIAAFICSATQDIATDALTALSFNKQERSKGNSIQSMGSFAGSLLGGGLLLMVYELIGWRPMFTALALFVVVMLLPLFYYQDRTLQVPRGKRPVGMADLYRFFTQRGVRAQIGFLFLYNAGLIGILAMMKPYLVDIGYSTGEIGLMFNVFGAGCGMLSSYIAGRFMKRVGRATAARGISVYVLTVTIILGGMIHYHCHAPWSVYLSLGLLWSAYGLATVVVYTIAMDYVRQGREGTDFTIQIVVLHFSSMLIAVLSGRCADAMGYSGLFALEALLALTSLCYLQFYFKHKLR